MKIHLTLRTCFALAALIVGTQALVLLWMGQPPICTCGMVKLWEGAVLSSGNSQHLTDWYTFSHIIHGFLFYLLLWYIFPRMPIWKRFLLALGMEAGWEILENTPATIQRYREQALSQGYVGDSVINSVMDTLAMMLGFLLARRWPLWTVIVLGFGMEIFVGYTIRDNLFLNITNFIHPFEFITNWQSGGG